MTETAFFNAYLNLTAAQLISLAHQPRSMIRRCHIHGESAAAKCNQLMDGAIKIFTPKHGVCYKFNSVHKDRLNESLTVDNTGPDNGLHLQIDVQGLKIYFEKAAFHLILLALIYHFKFMLLLFSRMVSYEERANKINRSSHCNGR